MMTKLFIMTALTSLTAFCIFITLFFTYHLETTTSFALVLLAGLATTSSLVMTNIMRKTLDVTA